MSNTSSPLKSQPAYLEDYSEDTNTVLPGTRQTANIAAKRSKPDINTKLVVAEKSRNAAGTNPGYSSQPGATVGTGSSSPQESKTQPPSLSPLRVRGSGKRNSIGAEMATSSRQGSPEKSSLRRTVSRSHKKENLRSDALESRESAARIRLSGTPLEAPSVPRQAAAERQPERPHRLRHTGPPSPQSTRSPRAAETAEPMLRPATARPRPTPAQGYSARPLSYHEGIPPPGPTAPSRRPDSLYLQTFSYQGPPQPVGYIAAPLSTSPQRQVAYPFPPTGFVPPYQPPQGPWVEPVRTASSRRASMYSARPAIEHSPVHQPYAPLYPQPAMARRLSVHRPSPVTPIEQGAYFVDDGPEVWYHNERDHKRDRIAMPPPSAPVVSTRPPQPRPSLKHSATTSTAHPPLHHRRSDRATPDFSYETSMRKLSIDEPRPASRPSMASRPSAASSITVGYGKHSPSDDRAPMPPSAMKHTRRQSYYAPDDREREAEAYQEAQTAGIKPVPLTAETIHKVMRRKSKTSGGSGSGSRAGSRAGSSREGSDVKISKSGSRSSMEKHRGGGGSEVRIRQDEGSGLTLTINGAAQGMQLGLKGDGVDGRTISFHPGPARGGQVEVRIGSRSAVSSRDRSTTDRSSTRYRYTGPSKAAKEIGQTEYSSRRRSRSRAGDVIVEKGKGKAEDDIAQGDVLERLRREARPVSRSRRNSKVDVIRSERVVRRETPEGQFF